MTQFESRTADWLSVGEAVRRVLAQAEPLEAEEVALADGLGRALARDLVATATLPPWDNSAMDGYAVRHQDVESATLETPVSLRVTSVVPAGRLARTRLGKAHAARIMTGAPVPPGADAIVRVEDTDAEADPGIVRIFAAVEAGRDIRPGGQDMRAGDRLLPAGTTMGPGQLGLVAASGSGTLWVRRRPRVAILSNGDEIAPLEEFQRVRAGKAIPETNAHTLAAAVAQIGGVPLPLGIARDTPESIQEQVLRARSLAADVLVTSGGASMGEYDLFKRVLAKLGFKLDFWRVRMRPGTPFSFGSLPGQGEEPPLPVFGLPGNPASSFVTFQIYCRPYLLRRAGHRAHHRRVMAARAGERFRSPEHLTHFFRVTVEPGPSHAVVRPSGPQTSGLVRAQGLAQGLAVVPEGVGEVLEGETLNVILLDDFGHSQSEPGFLPR